MSRESWLHRVITAAFLPFVLLPALARSATSSYRIEQLTSGSIHHRAPSINNAGEVIWMQEEPTEGWQIASQRRSKLTGPDVTWMTARYPALADDGSFVCFRERQDGACVGYLLRYPDQSQIEFCSRDRNSAAHRDPLPRSGVSSDGVAIWGREFYGVSGGLSSRRFFVSGVGEVSPTSLVSWNNPAINRAGEFVYDDGGAVFSSRRGAVIDGQDPAIGDRGDIAYVTGSEVRVLLASGETVTVGTGSAPGVNAEGTVAFERLVDDHYQIYLATLVDEELKADAGPDQTLTGCRETALLNGSGSTPHDAGLTYRWGFVLRPILSAASLRDWDTPFASFVPDQGGWYEIELVVSLDGKDSAPDTVRVHAPPCPELALSEPIGRRDGLVSIIGSFFPPGDVKLEASWKEGDPQNYTATADAGGAFITTIRVPQDAAPGYHDIVWTDDALVRARFRVLVSLSGRVWVGECEVSSVARVVVAYDCGVAECLGDAANDYRNTCLALARRPCDDAGYYEIAVDDLPPGTYSLRAEPATDFWWRHFTPSPVCKEFSVNKDDIFSEEEIDFAGRREGIFTFSEGLLSRWHEDVKIPPIVIYDIPAGELHRLLAELGPSGTVAHIVSLAETAWEEGIVPFLGGELPSISAAAIARVSLRFALRTLAEAIVVEAALSLLPGVTIRSHFIAWRYECSGNTVEPRQLLDWQGGAVDTQDSLEVKVESPVLVSLEDALGRRTGGDVNQGALAEIPGSEYSGVASHPQWIRVVAPGAFRLVLTGVNDGSYRLTVRLTNREAVKGEQVFEGNVSRGDRARDAGLGRPPRGRERHDAPRDGPARSRLPQGRLERRRQGGPLRRDLHPALSLHGRRAARVLRRRGLGRLGQARHLGRHLALQLPLPGRTRAARTGTSRVRG